MSLDGKLQTLSQLAHIIATLNNASVSFSALNSAATVLSTDIFNLVNKDSTANAISGTFNVGQISASPTEGGEPINGDKQTVNTKKETAPKATPKKVTAAAIIDDKPEVKAEEPAAEVVEEVSLTDHAAEESLTGDEPEPIDYVELRTECRTLINSAVDRVGKPAVVAILDYIHAKSLKDVKDTLLPWLRTKLIEAK